MNLKLLTELTVVRRYVQLSFQLRISETKLQRALTVAQQPVQAAKQQPMKGIVLVILLCNNVWQLLGRTDGNGATPAGDLWSLTMAVIT